MINAGIHVEAKYTASRITRHAGNPYIEALPPLPRKRSDFLLQLANYPPRPSSAIWEADEVARIIELQSISDIVFPFPFYEDVALTFATSMRDSYVARHPFDPLDQQRRHAIASEGKDGVPFPQSWKSTGTGFSLISISGMGKTTLVNSFFLHCPQVIHHHSYGGRKLECAQISYLILRVPHDATLRGFCLNFFTEIDSLTTFTKYRSQAESLHTIAPMVTLMNVVASACSIGIIIVDEVQNVRLAPRFGASMMLNLFAELIEKIGVSLAIIGTPAIGTILKQNALDARKLATSGSVSFPLLTKDSKTWKLFCKFLWSYRYTNKPSSLTNKIMNTWHEHCAGDIAFAGLLFWLAQRQAIGGREQIDETTFDLVSRTSMATLQPAISFLRSGKNADKGEFEDLLFSTDYDSLFNAYGGTTICPQIQPDFYTDEFQDLERIERASANPRRRRKIDMLAIVPELPVEQPLQRG